MKLQLPSVTLICIDCLNADRAAKVLEHCKSKVDFAEVKLLTSIPTNYQHAVKIIPINSLIAYSVFMLTKLHEYVSTPHVLVVQRDGWILNAESWDDDWLNLDYIGPLFIQYDKVGSGGFSLRSKRLIDYFAGIMPYWDGTDHGAKQIQSGLGYYEDGVIALGPQAARFKIGSLEQAARFSQGGNRNPEYFRKYPFGFHRTWQRIDFTTGEVGSIDLTRDLQAGYDNEIDML